MFRYGLLGRPAKLPATLFVVAISDRNGFADIRPFRDLDDAVNHAFEVYQQREGEEPMFRKEELCGMILNRGMTFLYSEREYDELTNEQVGSMEYRYKWTITVARCTVR